MPCSKGPTRCSSRNPGPVTSFAEFLTRSQNSLPSNGGLRTCSVMRKLHPITAAVNSSLKSHRIRKHCPINPSTGSLFAPSTIASSAISHSTPHPKVPLCWSPKTNSPNCGSTPPTWSQWKTPGVCGAGNGLEDTFHRLRHLNHALVLRWHWGKKWREWLQNWEGQLLYFPDYDPAGMRIFITEILPQRPTAQLLIPQNLQQLLEQSENRELFLKQEAYLPGLIDHPAVGEVCQWIRQSRKVVEQEALLI